MYEHNALGYWSGLTLCLTKVRSSRARCPATALIIVASAYSRVRYRSPNFHSSVCPYVRQSTLTWKFRFLCISDSCECESLQSNCP